MAKYKIIYYKSVSGTNLIKDFILGLHPRERAKIDLTIKLLENFGATLGPPFCKKIVGTPLWELRIKSKRLIRLFYVSYLKNQFVILHGFIKKTQKTPRKEIVISLKRLKSIS